MGKYWANHLVTLMPANFPFKNRAHILLAYKNLAFVQLSIACSKYLIKKHFFKKWAKPGLFSFILSFSHYNLNNTNWKKRRWFAWDTNPGPQDGWHRRNDGAMADSTIKNIFNCIILTWSIPWKCPNTFLVQLSFNQGNGLYASCTSLIVGRAYQRMLA